MRLSTIRPAAGLIGLALVVAAAASAGSPLSNDPSPLAVCQDTIRVAAIDLASDVRRGVGACLTRGVECVVGPAELRADCCDRAADRCDGDLLKVERARRRFVKQIVNRRCADVPFADVLAQLGYERLAERCAALDPAEAIDALEGLAACLDRLALAETACLIGTVELPRAEEGLACSGIEDRFADVVGAQLAACSAPVQPSPSPRGTPAPTSSAVVATATATPVRSATVSPSSTASPTSSPAVTRTHTPTPKATVTATPTTSVVATATPVPTTTATSTVIVTGTASATSTPARTATSTPAATLTATVTPLATTTPVATTTAVATTTPGPTTTINPTASTTATPQRTATVTPQATTTATVNSTRTVTPVPTVTATPIPTTTATRTSTPVATVTASRTATPVPTNTATRTSTPVATVTASRTATPVPTTTATPTGPVCGNGAKEAGEDCDDGNTLDCDSCPSNCHTAPADCPVGTTRAAQTVRLVPPTGQSLTSSVICLSYPAASVGLPGTGLVTQRASGFQGSVSINDVNNAVTVGMLGRNVLSEINVTLSFDLCTGATAPPPTAFACRVVSASNAGASIDPNAVACTPVTP